MKTFLIAALALANLNAFAETYTCKEQQKPGALGGSVIRVVVTETAKLKNTTTKSGMLFDHLFKVDVKITSSVGPRTKTLKKFSSLATVEDVVYSINAVKKEGVKIRIFLDEPEDAWMELSSEGGAKRDVRLTCNWANDGSV